MPDADREDLALLEEAAREAGAIALRFFSAGARHWLKNDTSPVTEADMAVDEMLRERLMAARPDYGWLSEECVDDRLRLKRRRTFIVDPIDGTRAFMDQENGWVISAAVVEKGKPVAGVLFAPARGDIWTAIAGGGARRNDQPIRTTERAEFAGAQIAASRKSVKLAGLAAHERDFDRRFTKSLAFRLARVADGRFDAAFASSNARDWDLAAAILLVQEAGGRVSDLTGKEIRLNRPDVRHPPLVAAGAPLHAAIVAAAKSGSPGPAPTETTR